MMNKPNPRHMAMLETRQTPQGMELYGERQNDALPSGRESITLSPALTAELLYAVLGLPIEEIPERMMIQLQALIYGIRPAPQSPDEP